MAKLTVVLLADAETHEQMARAANAFEMVKDAKQANLDVELILDGAGTRWVRELAKRESKMRGLFEEVRDKVTGVCEYCAGEFGVTEGCTHRAFPSRASSTGTQVWHDASRKDDRLLRSRGAARAREWRR